MSALAAGAIDYKALVQDDRIHASLLINAAEPLPNLTFLI